MTLVFASPLLALWGALSSRPVRLGVIGVAFLGPIAALSAGLCLVNIFLLSLWIPDVLLHDHDASFELLRTERVGTETFSVFRTNGGAMTSFGIVVRRDRPLLPGVVWTSHACSCSPAFDVSLSRVDRSTIQCVFPSDRGLPPRSISVHDVAG